MSYTDKDFLTAEEFIEVLNISRSTLNRWIRSGRIKVIRINPNNPKSSMRIPTAEIAKLLNESEVTGE